MQILEKREYRRAAQVFAEGFADDPAFSLVLQGIAEPTKVLEKYFFNYIQECKELLLYKCADADGYLCIYRFDTEFAEFAVPAPMEQLEQFTVLEQRYQSDFAVLDILAVEKQSRGKGLAGKMVEFFIKYCRKEKLTPLVEVFTDKYLDLYLSRGFKITYRREHQGVTTYILEYKDDCND